MTFRKAQRTFAKLRLAITGTAGSGKTYSALLLAFGLGGKIAMIDTENGSGDLYSSLGDYDICALNAPFDPRKYIQAIHDAEQAGYNIIIIDSLSHAWNADGGILDLQSKITANSKSGNSFTAWAKVIPLHNQLIQTILSSTCHVIATMRSKPEYIQTKDEHGRSEVKKVGLAPIQRDGIDYEFGTVLDISSDHSASVSKDRTGLFPDVPFTISRSTGETLRKWLNEPQDTKKGDNNNGSEAVNKE